FLHTYLTRPMHVLGAAGLVSMGLGGVSLLATVWMKYLMHPRVLMTGNPLLLLSVMLELVGVQFISMGLIGELLTRTYFESERKFALRIQGTLPRAVPLESVAGVQDVGGGVGKGSTDVGDVSWVAPTTGFTTACWVPGTPAHSWQAVAAGGTSIGRQGMQLAA